METSYNLEIIINIPIDNKMPDVLAYVCLKFMDSKDRPLILNGSTLRKSKYNNAPYLVPASRSKGMGKGFYKFIFCDDKDQWKEIEDEAVQKYNKIYSYDQIPIIQEDGKGKYAIT